MNIIIATVKSWNVDRAQAFAEDSEHQIEVITDKQNLNVERVSSLEPDYLFFPHWSWMIPEKIVDEYECVVFHMTDVPFGRGGSPLQNLIARGFERTKMSAIRAMDEVDAGDVFLKRDLCLHGSAEEIFLRAADLVFEDMIPYILENQPEPEPQQGEVVTFSRRSRENGELQSDFDLDKIYDYIRMLDAEGYPDAFIEFGPYMIKFHSASRTHDGIQAQVEIIEKEDE